MKNKIKNSVMLLLFTGIILSGCTMDSFLFNTKKLDKYQLPNNNIPDSLLEPVTLTSGGNKLYGYYIKAAGAKRVKTILYMHGNKESLDQYWDRAIWMHETGVNVFIFDYRGFGMSEGTSSEQGMHEDAEAALDFISNTKHIPADSLCLFGYSLGNVCSIYLAAEKIKPGYLIAESPFASANSLTQGSTGLDIPPLWLTSASFDNAELIKKIKTRFLLMHGKDDSFVRYDDNGRVVFNNAPEPKKLMLIEKASHNDIPSVMGIENYKKAISSWLNQ